MILGPILGVSLYKVFHPTPYLLNGIILAGLLAYAWFNPTLRRVGAEPATDEDSTQAQLERVEEGGGSL